MSLHKIRSALVQTFESGGFGLPVVYDNTGGYTPQANTPYAEFFFMPNQPTVFTLGDDGDDEHTGIVQVNLNYPLSEGSGAVLQKVDQIRDVFKAGAALTYDTQLVRVISCGLSRASQFADGFYQSILTIEWRAHTAR